MSDNGGAGGNDKKKEEGAADKGTADKTKNCPPGKSCVVRDFAKNINSFGDVAGAVGDKINKAVEAKAASVASGIGTAIKNPVLCAANAVTAVPQMVEGVFNAVANGMDRVGTSAKKMTENIAGMAVDDDGFPNIFAPFKIVILSTMKNIQGMFGNMVFGADKWAKILADPNMKTDKIVDDMSKASEAFNRIVDSPAFQKIFNKWLMGYAEAMDKLIQMGKPKIDGVTNKLTGIVTDTSNKIGAAFTKSLTNIIGAALKSIPGVGIVFNVAELAHKMAAKIVSVCEPAVTKGGVSMISIANAGVDQVKNAQCKVEELTKSLAHLFPAQKGGEYRMKMTHRYNNRYNRKKIMRATKRVKVMLGKFTKKHGAALNYASKLKTRRRLYG